MDIAERVKRIQGSERSQRKITVPKGSIRMDLGDPDFPTPPHIQEAALKAMRDNFTHYGNAFGEEDLREAICFSTVVLIGALLRTEVPDTPHLKSEE